ncbi:MAG: arginase family protein [Asticcacaulis sp.]|nr:arginase family protein [Asticcacaulis sp.]
MVARLLAFTGAVADRNPRGLPGAATMADAIATRHGLTVETVAGSGFTGQAAWPEALEVAGGNLRTLQNRYADLLATGDRPVLAMSRCAAGLATVPAVAKARPDLCLVWFDAHGDSNTPETSSTGYLGGMVISAAIGLWDSGFGSGLDLSQVVLVGARDLDPAERDLVDNGRLVLVPPGGDMAAALAQAVAGRPVYIHLDCDVLDAGIVPTEYGVDGGLSLADLHACAEVLARSEVIGLEIAEYEVTWPDGRPGSADGVVAALEPVLRRLA